MQFYYLPKEYRSIHSACFELIYQIEEFVVGEEYASLWVSHTKLTKEEKEHLDECGDIWEFFKKYKADQFYKLLSKQLLLGLLKDFCYFMQESMDCSNKSRLVVSYALLRRPLVDDLKILLRILFEDSFYDKFIEKDDFDPAYMKDDDLMDFLKRTDNLRFVKPIKGEFIYDCIYQKDNPDSITNLSNRALHPVTTRPWNKTGAMNCNFMFVMPDDVESLWECYYTYLPVILIFYSELFNIAVFRLFEGEVDMDLYPKRLEKMASIMEAVMQSETNNINKK